MAKQKKMLILITVCLVLLFGAGSFFVLNFTGPQCVAKIYQNNQLLYEIDLNQVKESYSITIDGENGQYNEVLVEPGQIGMQAASCPDKTCVNTGKISSGVLPIVCLPNHVYIVIDSGEEEYDAKSY